MAEIEGSFSIRTLTLETRVLKLQLLAVGTSVCQKPRTGQLTPAGPQGSGEAKSAIFPAIFAGPKARATRRYKELLDRGEAVSYEDVLENVQKRDYIDSHREFSPLRKAEDAIAFDNSDMGLVEQSERLKSIAQRYIEKE